MEFLTALVFRHAFFSVIIVFCVIGNIISVLRLLIVLQVQFINFNAFSFIKWSIQNEAVNNADPEKWFKNIIFFVFFTVFLTTMIIFWNSIYAGEAY